MGATRQVAVGGRADMRLVALLRALAAGADGDEPPRGPGSDLGRSDAGERSAGSSDGAGSDGAGGAAEGSAARGREHDSAGAEAGQGFAAVGGVRIPAGAPARGGDAGATGPSAGEPGECAGAPAPDGDAGMAYARAAIAARCAELLAAPGAAPLAADLAALAAAEAAGLAEDAASEALNREGAGGAGAADGSIYAALAAHYAEVLPLPLRCRCQASIEAGSFSVAPCPELVRGRPPHDVRMHAALGGLAAVRTAVPGSLSLWGTGMFMAGPARSIGCAALRSTLHSTTCLMRRAGGAHALTESGLGLQGRVELRARPAFALAHAGVLLREAAGGAAAPPPPAALAAVRLRAQRKMAAWDLLLGLQRAGGP